MYLTKEQRLLKIQKEKEAMEDQLETLRAELAYGFMMTGLEPPRHPERKKEGTGCGRKL